MTDGPSGPGREWPLAALLLALAAVAYGPALLGAPAMDADRALVVLMAEAFARGEWSLYFWQQNYMASLEPLLLTPLAALGALTPATTTLVALAVTGVLAWLSLRLARRLGGAVWLTGLFWAVPPAVVVHHHTALYGARLVATALAVGAFLLALRARDARGWIGAGALLGLAYLGDHMMIGWVAGVVSVAALRGGMGRLALGALPPVVLDAVAATMTPAAHLAGPNDPGAWIRTPWTLLTVTLPQLVGLLWSRAPGPDFVPPGPLVPGASDRVAWAVAAAVGGAALLALAVAGAGRVLRGARRLWEGMEGTPAGSDPAPTSDLAATGLVVACAASLAVFLLVGGDGERWPVRYLVPLWPALSALAGAAVASWRPRLRPAAALALLPAAFTLATEPTWPGVPEGAEAERALAEADRAVAAVDVEVVAGDYWDVYRVARVARGPGAPEAWSSLSVIDRRPEWTARLGTAERIGYLIHPADAERRAVLEGLPDASGERREGPTLLGVRPAGPFDLYVTSGPVTVLDTRAGPPTRSWSALAALSAGFLFLGVLALGGLAAAYRSRTVPSGRSR